MNRFLLVCIVLFASLLGGCLSPFAGITSFFFLTVLLFFATGPEIGLEKDELACILFALCGVVSVLYSRDKWGAILFSGSLVAGSLFYVALRNSSGWERSLLAVLVVGGCISVCAEALRQVDVLPYALFYNLNPFSGFLAPLVPVCLYRYKGDRRKRYAVAAGVILFGNLISGSRTGVFTMAMALIALLVFFWWGKDRNAIKALFLVFAAGLCAFLVFSGANDFWMVKGSVGMTEKLPTGILQRTYLLKVTLEVIGRAPVLGQGLNSFKAAMSSLSNPYVLYPVVHAHSLYLNILAELGVVGLGLFLLFLWFVVKGPFNSAVPIKIALFSFLFHNIVEYNFPAPPFQMLFYLLCAVIMQQKDAEREILRLSGGVRRIACALVALCFLVMHLFPAVGFLLLGRADAALQEQDTAKTLRYLLASTYFGYPVPTIHEQTAGFITQVYAASNPKQNDLLRVAEAGYLRALALNTMDGALYLRIADFYVRTGRPAQAEALLSRAITIYPYHQIYRIMQSRLYAHQGRYGEAIRILEESDRFFAKFAPLHRERRDVLWGLATLYGEQKDTERSREYQARARRLADQIEDSSDKRRTGP